MTSLFRSGTAGLGSLRPSPKPPPAIGRKRFSRDERKARIATLTILLLQRLKKRACSMKQLMADVSLGGAYETELRTILSTLVASNQATKLTHGGRLFYKGTP